MSERVAVVLFNLGGPDKPESIRPFLLNFFNDPNIIRAPKPVRWLVAQLIAYRRTKKEAGQSYGRLGGGSPLLANTMAQADALGLALKTHMDFESKVFVAMRYWHPMADEVVRAVAAYAPDRVILLPLYPQYSTTTTRSSYQAWMAAASKAGLRVPTRLVCCYPFEEGFIEASARLVARAYQDARAAGTRQRILFSAHGLPVKVIEEGDPYQWQCEETAALIARRVAAITGISDIDWQICYQSRVGPLAWIGPSTEEALEKAAHDQVGVVIYPHAFVSEHVETLVEIEEEYREMAHEMGVPSFARVPTVSADSGFIAGLAHQVVTAWREGVAAPPVAPIGGQSLCPRAHGECAMREFCKVEAA